MLRYMGRYPNNHTSFVCIKTKSIDSIENTKPKENRKSDNSKTNANTRNDMSDNDNNVNTSDISFVLPIELEVTQEPSIYSPLEIIDFGYVAIRQNNLFNEHLFPSLISTSSLRISPFITNSISYVYNSLTKVVSFYLTNSAPTSLEIKVIKFNKIST